ncbi:MAG: hypothetical protein PHT33_08665, partial [bacterium]|nr:hypothetical protein [bacterium]
MRTFVALISILLGAIPAYAWGPVAHCQINSTSWHRTMSGYGGPARAGEIFVENAPMPDLISNYNIRQNMLNKFIRKGLHIPETNNVAFDYAHNLFSNTGRMLDVGGDDNSRGVPLFGLYMLRLADGDKSAKREIYRAYAEGWAGHQLADSTMHGIYGIAERFDFLPPGMIGALTSFAAWKVGRHGCLEAAVDAVNCDNGETRVRLRGGKKFFEAPIVPWLIHEASLEMLRDLPVQNRKRFKAFTGDKLVDKLGFTPHSGDKLIAELKGSYDEAISNRIAGILPGSLMVARMIRHTPQYEEIKAFYNGYPLKTYFTYYHGQIPVQAVYGRLPAQLKRDLAAAGIASSRIGPGTYLPSYDHRLPYSKSVRKVETFLKNPRSALAGMKPSCLEGRVSHTTELYTGFIADVSNE